MKKRFVLVVITVLVFAVFAGACAASKPSSDMSGGAPSTGESGYSDGDASYDAASESSDLMSRERKIIRTVNFNMETDDFAATVALIRGNLQPVGWFESQEVTNKTYAYFSIRVKTDKLDEFVASLESGGTISNYYETSVDISEQYSNIEMHIESLEAELQRLYELLEKATLNDSFTISARISALETQINILNASLNYYDSRVDYSTLTIYLNAKAEPSPALPYGERVKNVFVGAWSALGEMFKWIWIILLAVFPFLLGIGVPVTAIIVTVHLVKKSNRKKAAAAQAAAQANAPDKND